MQNVYYAIVGFTAIIIHLIINYDIILGHFQDRSQIAYRRFLISLIAFFAADTLWGVLAAIGNIQLLYADTILYCFTLAISIVLWCQYTVAYLNFGKQFEAALRVIGIVFGLSAVAVLAINHFYHFFFWISDDGNYQTYFVRRASMIFQIILFTATTIQALIVTASTHGKKRIRHLTVALFGLVMIFAVIVQTYFPLLPSYTVGFLIGCCVLHVFVQEARKRDFRIKLEESTRVIEAAGYGIWKFIFDKDSDNVCGLIGNKKWDEVFGTTGAQMTPKERLDFYSNRITNVDLKDLEDDYKAMKGGAIRTRIFEWMHPTKGLIYLSVGGTRFVEADGSISISGFVGDVTKEKFAQNRLNNSLEKAMKQAEAANLAKSRFLFNMSHDIRTPMNAIIGFTNLLQKSIYDKERCTDYIQKIQQSSQFLLSLINNVLEMARIESGKASLDIAVHSTSEFIQGFRSVFEEQMKLKGLTFTVNSDYQHDYLYSDALKIREVFLNLLSNAYKYTPSGGRVTVDVKELPATKEGYCIIQITVADTGIGMSKDFIPHLFEEFIREKTYTDNKIEGTGLGMPIAKKNLDLMDGTISVESEINRGTTFVVNIPLRIAEAPTEEPQSKRDQNLAHIRGKRVLVTEDNDLNAEIAIEMLKSLGLEAERAEDGIQSLIMIGCKPALYYDLILMDIQMPNMDGYRTTQIIRQMSDSMKANIPILAMTANAFEEDKKAALEAGMNGHIAKPIDINVMTNEILKQLG